MLGSTVINAFVKYELTMYSLLEGHIKKNLIAENYFFFLRNKQFTVENKKPIYEPESIM